MSYKVSLRGSFNRDLKGFGQAEKGEILDLADDIQADPSIGSAMTGNMKGLSKYSFNRKPEIRIIYVVYDCHNFNKKTNVHTCLTDGINHTKEELEHCHGLVEFVWVKTREECNNLYAQRKKYFKNVKRKLQAKTKEKRKKKGKGKTKRKGKSGR